MNRAAQLVFSTISLPQFKFYGHLFYRHLSAEQCVLSAYGNSNTTARKKVKVVPNQIGELLTESSLAYWFMDHGSQKSKKSKGVLLNTQSFTKAEVEKLCVLLHNRFGLLASPRAQKSRGGLICFQIYISGKSYQRLKQLIYPFLLPLHCFAMPRDVLQISNSAQQIKYPMRNQLGNQV